MQVYKYDDKGYFIEPVIIEANEDGSYTIPNSCTDVELPQPNYKPHFNIEKNEWEDITKEEWLTSLPEQPSPPQHLKSAVKAVQSVQQTFEKDSWNVVIFDSIKYDYLDEYDEQGKFQVQEDGIYLITAIVTLNNTTTGSKAMLSVYVNDREYARLDDNQNVQSEEFILSGSTTLKLNSGDYLYIYAYVGNETTTVADDIITHFECTRVG